MKSICYILFSQKLNKFYIGVTTENIIDRIEKHNNSEYGKHRYTATTNDWEVFLTIELEDYSHAVRLERKIKSMKSSKYIQNLKRYPELIEKIILETKSI
jgi:putative endonuclease